MTQDQNPQAESDVPEAAAAGTAKKAAAKRTAAKKTAATKTAAKKTAAKKTATGTTAATRTTTRKTAAAKSAEQAPEQAPEAPAAPRTRKAPAKRTAATTSAAAPAESAAATDDAAPAPVAEATTAEAEAPATTSAAKKTAAKKTAAKKTTAKKTTAKKTTATKTAAKKTAAKKTAAADEPAVEPAVEGATTDEAGTPEVAVLFQAPAPASRSRRTSKKAAAPAPVVEPAEDADETEEETLEVAEVGADEDVEASAEESTEAAEDAEAGSEDAEDGDAEDGDDAGGAPRRRRRRGGRRRRRGGSGAGGEAEDADDEAGEEDAAAGAAAEGDAESAESGESAAGDSAEGGEASEGTGSRRRRRRRREGDADSGEAGDGATTTRVRKARSPEDEITAVSGSTRLEAKKQRRREGREAGRRRAPIVSEAEFLARRESVDRVMVVRQRADLTQIGVLEDKVLVEHYVARESQTSLIGNIYLGRVQNVLPSMEAAFIDIGKGRNAVLYAGEVNWSALGHKDGQPRKIESVLSSGQTVLVQVSKDPIGHKGARLTSQISLPGRFLVYVPDGTTSGISRKLPDTERTRLKTLLKEIVPDTAGVIVRTAAEGASEEELTRDVERLKARWEDIEGRIKSGGAPTLLYGEPDLTLKVVRDLFTEDFSRLVVQGEDAWNTVQPYVEHMAPDLEERLERYEPADHDGVDLFSAYRVDEQIAKALDRKVWLPSGGSLIIDRTEAMTVVDVNTGKFTGSGGNLEETVTRNNLEAAEEVVRQLRLRDIGGIIVVDFIDMVLESNRDLVLRRLVECLGRDRTRHQVAEVTSLGLVQMTRKRIGTGLLEAFSENCEHCHGRGLTVHDMPVEPKRSGGGNGGGGNGGGGNSGGNGGEDEGRRSGRRRGGRGRNAEAPEAPAEPVVNKPSPAAFAAMAKHAEETEAPAETPAETAAETAAEAPVAEVEEAAAPTVTTRPARRSRRTSAPAAAAPVAEEPSATEPAEEPAEEPVVEEPVVEEPVGEDVTPETPETPEPAAGTTTVSTRTRRGASRRVATAPAEPVGPIVVEAAAAPTPLPEAPAPTVTVTTRSRGGGRRRPAADPAPE